MKKFTMVAVSTLALSAALNAACTVSLNGVQIGMDAGSARPSGDGATQAASDAGGSDAATSYNTCAECGAARCASETSACNAVKSGEQSSPCKGYGECVSVCSGTDSEKASCKAACAQAYPEADALYTCLENKCALSCISN